MLSWTTPDLNNIFFSLFFLIFWCIDYNIFDIVKRIWALGKCAIEINYLLLLFFYYNILGEYKVLLAFLTMNLHGYSRLEFIVLY